MLIVGIVVLLVAGVAALFWALPQIAESQMRDRLDQIESRLGLKIDVQGIETTGVSGVVAHDLVISDPRTTATIVKVGKSEAAVSFSSLLTGSPKLTTLQISDVEFSVHIDEHGKIETLETLRGQRTDSTEEASPNGPSGRLARWIDRLPDRIEASHVSVKFIVAPGGPTIPVSALSLDEALFRVSRDTFSIATVVHLERANGSEGFELPPTVSLDFTFDHGLAPVSGEAKFDGVLALTGLPPFPWLRVGTKGFGIDDESRLYLDDLEVGVFGSEERRLLDVRRLAAKPNSLAPSNLGDLSLEDLKVQDATIHLVRDQNGAFALGDALNLSRPGAAFSVVNSARQFADEHASEDAEPADLDLANLDDDTLADDTPVEVEDDESEGSFDALKSRLPARVSVENLSIVGSFPRPPAVLRPARSFSMRNGKLELEHDSENGKLDILGGFEAQGDKVGRGEVAVELDLDYQQMTLDGELKIDALDLSWIGLVVGKRFASTIPGGTLRADLTFDSVGPQAFRSKGLVSLEGMTINSAALALEPMRDITASYTFEALFDARAPLPSAKLLDVDLYKSPESEGGDEALLPPTPIGALKFSSGAFSLNGASGQFRPALYGFNAPQRRPARLDVEFELPLTPVTTLFEAVPDALKGSAVGTQLKGEFAYTLLLEVPLYRASDMKWSSEPDLRNFEVVKMPHEVDVSRMLGPLTVEITDSIEEEDDFQRTIQLDAPQPYPATWLLENSGLTIEQIDERRRRREWPPLPDPYATRLSTVITDRPQVWLTPWALGQAAPKPWSDEDEIRSTKEQPYGPYVFVPLHHISAYMPLAVMTTEDNSFFKHKGFNTLAFKASIERNLEASAFKRGASTIAMQTVKNVFLHRKKVVSRKIQEAFLVFLMESVVDVPKARIMEVYLNVIEFGPGIFGIHDAAVHYFGKRPDALTIGEVAWLVSIIPNPKRYHFYYERGEITPRWFARMKRYIQVMHNRERISEEELEAALEAPPEFYKPERDEPVLRPKPAPSLFVPLDLFDDTASNPEEDERSQTDSTPPTPSPSETTRIPLGLD